MYFNTFINKMLKPTRIPLYVKIPKWFILSKIRPEFDMTDKPLF